jgi:photoactive yellow protein
MVTFYTTGIADALDAMTPEQLDGLDFGVVRMKQDGSVTAYNRFESHLSGIDPQNALGKDFFVQVAPCTNNYMVAHRFRESGDLDEIVDYVFTYVMVPTPVTLRLVKRADSEYQYLLVATHASTGTRDSTATNASTQ